MTLSTGKINLIGLSGKKQSGKDAFGKFLRVNVEHSHRLAFGDFVKTEVAEACGVPAALIEAKKEMFRPILQWWGTDFRRDMNGNDYWVEQLAHAYHYLKNETLTVVTDVRFANEAKFIKDNGGLLVRVNRVFGSAADLHRSETSLDGFNFDLVVDNNGTLEQLKQQADNLIKQYGIHPSEHKQPLQD